MNRVDYQEWERQGHLINSNIWAHIVSAEMFWCTKKRTHQEVHDTLEQKGYLEDVWLS